MLSVIWIQLLIMKNLTDNQKEKYRSILKKQYQDLKYDIVSEKI